MRVGDRVEDFCRPCKSIRAHAVQVVGPDGEPSRVMCDTCSSEHNYRRGALPRSSEGTAPATPPHEPPKEAAMFESRDAPDPGASDLESVLRRVLREEAGIPPTAPAEKWRGGEMVLRPGKPGLQEKAMPIDALFHKVVMVRNKLRVLEQQVNGSDMPDDLKLKLQGYITGCYGSLTSFNVLFADEADKFKGAGAKD